MVQGGGPPVASGFSGRGALPTVPTARPVNDPVYDDIDEFEAQFMASQPEYANHMTQVMWRMDLEPFRPM